MRFGLYLGIDGSASLASIEAEFRAAEAAGFHSAWTGQVRDHDLLGLLSIGAAATRRIELGSWVLPAPLQHPVALAQRARTLQLAAGTRLALGIGSGHAELIRDRLGLPFDRPAARMREYLEVLRALLIRGECRFEGDFQRVDFRFGAAGPAAPPLLLAALGPRMLAVAGGHADGVCCWLGGLRYLEDFALPRLRAAAEAAGRRQPLRIVCGLPVLLAQRSEAAQRACAEYLGSSARLPAYRAVLERGGAASAVSVAMIGGETELRREFERLAAVGVSDFNAAIPPDPAGDVGAGARTREFLARLARESGASGTRTEGE